MKILGLTTVVLTGTLTFVNAGGKTPPPLPADSPRALQGIQSHAPAIQLPQKPVAISTHPPLVHLSQFVRDKGIFLFYSFNPSSPIYWHNFVPRSVINQAQTAGIKYLEVRVGYSNWVQIAPGAQETWFNQLLDLARSHDIRVIGWVVPYINNSSASTIRASLNGDWQVLNYLAHYKTPSGGRLSGLAMDMELGPLYFGGNTQALKQYVEGARTITGPSYPLIGIIPDPVRTGLTSQKGSAHYYPYNQIANYCNVLQPMAYWHEYYASSHFDYTPSYVENFIKDSITSTQEQDQNPSKPINLALQFFGNSLVGYPSETDLKTSLQSAQNDGAIGISAFQWHTLNSQYWTVLSEYSWRGN